MTSKAKDPTPLSRVIPLNHSRAITHKRVSRLTVSPNTANILDLMINKAARDTRHTPSSTSRASTLPKVVLDMDSMGSLPKIAATRHTLPSNSSTRKVAAARAPRTMAAHPRTSKDSLKDSLAL